MPVNPPRAILSPTNTGKTYEALERMLSYRSGMIGFPLRLLARENYDKLTQRLGRQQVALLTGEEKILPEGARYFCCTVESMPIGDPVEFLAIDEIQLAADPERGHVFTDRILHARGIKQTLFLGSETITPLLKHLVPGIQIEARPRFSSLAYTGRTKLSRLPRRSAIVGFSVEDVYAQAEMLRRMRGGAAIVMGALSPRARNAQVSLYQSGDVDFIVATDAIGMGLNMDIDHVAFARLSKFDGRHHRKLRADELAQIAGRAGRYQKDGSFSTLPDTGGLETDIISAIENHQFPSLQAVYWRNSRLDFASPQALLKSLQMKPQSPILLLKRDAIDQLALEQMLKKKPVLESAADERAVNLLWQVCQIPDFRKTLNEAHFQLLSDVFLLLSDRGYLPDDWAEQQVRRLENTQGDIDALMTRIAHVRTWTYIAHRNDWFRDPESWQQRTRHMEDSLSDALHQQLTHQFVDRRSSALLRKLAANDLLKPEISKLGAVYVESHYLGKLNGFKFRPDDDAPDASGQALMKVARKALVEEVKKLVRELTQEKGKTLHLSPDGSIFWRKQKIAYLVKGPNVMLPQVRVLKSDLLEPRDAFEVQKLATDWIHEKVLSHFRPLFELKDYPINGYTKGFIFELFDGFGSRRTKDVREAITCLRPDEKEFLIQKGVYFGQLATFLKGCTRQHQFDLRVILARTYLELEPHICLDSGQVVLANSVSLPKAFYNLCGFYILKSQAVRLDYLEKLATKVRRGTKKGNYRHPVNEPEKGLSPATWKQVLALLGYLPDRQDETLFHRHRAKKGKARAKPLPQRQPLDAGHPFAALQNWGSPEA